MLAAPTILQTTTLLSKAQLRNQAKHIHKRAVTVFRLESYMASFRHNNLRTSLAKEGHVLLATVPNASAKEDRKTRRELHLKWYKSISEIRYDTCASTAKTW